VTEQAEGVATVEQPPVDVDEPLAVADSSLVQRCRFGDEAAFDSLITRHRSRTLAIAHHMLGDRDAAEDVVQEAFVRVFLRIRELRGDGAFGGWLRRIVMRLCVDHERRRAAGEVRMSEPPAEGRQAGDPVTAIAVRQALDRLSPKLRSVLVLRDLEGMDYHTIADTLGIPLGTVRSRLSAARLTFKELYRSHVLEGEEDLP
jgi:RNA polymerase sigma-70 factor (ECF subfamily)